MTEKIFDIVLDTKRYARHNTFIAKKQIPFAVAKTLTMTAQDAQGDIRQEMSGAMTLRSGWAKAGVRITPARKSDGLHRMSSVVGHKDWYMAEQMGKLTSIRRARKADYLYIPRGIRRTKTGKISKPNRPAQILKKKNVYFAKTGRDRGAIFKTTRNRRTLLYSAIKQQTIKPKMDLNRTANAVAARGLNKNYIKAMRMAMRTAR